MAAKLRDKDFKNMFPFISSVLLALIIFKRY